MTQPERHRRHLQTSPSLLSTKSLYPTESLPTITTLDPSSSHYPAQSSISSVQNPVLPVEDELQSESETQQANTKQESSEGGTTSDFVKKLYRCVSKIHPKVSKVSKL